MTECQDDEVGMGDLSLVEYLLPAIGVKWACRSQLTKDIERGRGQRHTGRKEGGGRAGAGLARAAGKQNSRRRAQIDDRAV